MSETAEYNDNNQLTKYSLIKDTTEINEAETIESGDTLEIIPATTTASSEASTSTPVTTESVISSIWQSVTTIGNKLSALLSLSYAETGDEAAAVVPSDISSSVGDLDSIVTSTTEPTPVITDKSVEAASTTIDSLPLVPESSVDTAPVQIPETKPLFAISFAYDTQGNLTQTKSGSGFTTTYSYNPNTDTLDGKTVYDSNNNALTTLSYKTDSRARVIGIGSNSFTYSDDTMLVTDGNTHLRYDERGNRIELRTSADNTQYTYEGNRLLSAISNTGRTVSYTYNERGGVTEVNDSQSGIKTFFYTLDGAISEITTDNETVGYTYDALGRRLNRTSSLTGTIEYQYTGTNLKKVRNSDGIVLREYFYTPTNQLVAVKINDTLYSVVTDRNESVSGLINESTGEYLSQTYDTWGAVTESTFPSEFDLGYLGAFSENAFGYSILGPRVYDPAIGRFLAKDPLPGIITDTLSQNEYIYAKNDPLNQSDPTGHASEPTENSSSPKRALVDTNNAITDIKEQLQDAKELESTLKQAKEAAPEDSSLAEFYIEAIIKTGALEDILSTLQAIKTEQEQAILENESSIIEVPVIEYTATTTAESILEISPESAATTTVIEMLPEISTTTTTEEILVPETSTSSEVADTPALIEIDQNTVPIETTPTPGEDNPLPTQTENIDSVESVPATTEASLLNTILLSVAKSIDSHLLKAEAKKKHKSSTKNKKSKKAVSSKAKKSQDKKAKQTAKQKSQLVKAQKQLLAVAAAQLKITQASVQTKIPVPTPKTSSLAGMVGQNNKDVAQITTAPTKPATFNNPVSGINLIQSPSAGITPATLTFGNNLGTRLKGWFNGSKEYLAVGVSLIPVVGEIYDGWTIYAQKDPITGEKLTIVGNAFTILGLGTIAGSGKVAREIGESALRKGVQKTGANYDLINETAEEVLKEVDLIALARSEERR